MDNVILISGPAGCGLSSAEFVFEELGYYVIKNAPASSVRPICEELLQRGMNNIAFVSHATGASQSLTNLRGMGSINFRYIVLNTAEEELLKRFYLTRHVHPRTVTENISPEEAIRKDIKDTLNVVNEANLYIDTTTLTVKQLRQRLYKFLEDVEENKMTSLNFISFGIKNGIPQGIDTFFDVRQIPNPYWVEELKELTGEDQKVIDYMNSFPATQELIDAIVDYLKVFLQELQKSGRGSYVIGIACSGGQHRSVYVADYLANYFKKEFRTSVTHRDTPLLNK